MSRATLPTLPMLPTYVQAARAAVERVLWNETEGYYRSYTGGHATMADSLYAQAFRAACRSPHAARRSQQAGPPPPPLTLGSACRC